MVLRVTCASSQSITIVMLRRLRGAGRDSTISRQMTKTTAASIVEVPTRSLSEFKEFAFLFLDFEEIPYASSLLPLVSCVLERHDWGDSETRRVVVAGAGTCKLWSHEGGKDRTKLYYRKQGFLRGIVSTPMRSWASAERNETPNMHDRMRENQMFSIIHLIASVSQAC